MSVAEILLFLVLPFIFMSTASNSAVVQLKRTSQLGAKQPNGIPVPYLNIYRAYKKKVATQF